VPGHPTDENLSVGTPIIHPCATPARQFSASNPARRTSGLSEHAPQWNHRGGQVRRSKTLKHR